jgi:hypothetical protein
MADAAEARGTPPLSPSPKSKGRLANDESVDDGRFNVSWDGDTDPTNPMNWTQLKRWSHIAYISLLTFLM